MISVIICSRKNRLSEELVYNINNTIGVDYELIVIDNSNCKYSIYEAYNEGIRKSKGVFWCFIHDDIRFLTPKWGQILIYIFKSDDNIGLVGVAGSKIKTKTPSGWWESKENVLNIIQHYSSSKKEVICTDFLSTEEEVVAIDGVLMAMPKDNFFLFNSQIKSFHGYDLNLSFEQLISGKKIVVTNRILLEHYSNGTIDEKWIESIYMIHKLYKRILPLNSTLNKVSVELEVLNGKKFIEKSIEFNKKFIALKVWLNIIKIYPFSSLHIKILKLFIKTFFKK